MSLSQLYMQGKETKLSPLNLVSTPRVTPWVCSTVNFIHGILGQTTLLVGNSGRFKTSYHVGRLVRTLGLLMLGQDLQLAYVWHFEEAETVHL